MTPEDDVGVEEEYLLDNSAEDAEDEHIEEEREIGEAFWAEACDEGDADDDDDPGYGRMSQERD